MDNIRSVSLLRWATSFLGVAILAAIFWFFAPFWHPLAAVWPRVVVIFALLVLWAGCNFWLDRRRRWQDASLAEGLVAPAPADMQSREIIAQETALAEKLKTALAVLRRARGARSYLYEQPWYILIGPPGAGKTTALLNAGLKFPLAGELGQTAIGGVGGTRLCDWWFTDDAVLIDTAGRYTTQDSDQAVDRAGWLGFLDLLKRHRPRQPLNGVIIAIALSDVAGAAPAERAAHAQAIRARVKEIVDKLGVRVPLYVLLTKADLIAGFTEFYDDLDTNGRAQVWGVSFPAETTLLGHADSFSSEFALLVGRVEARLIDRMQAERSPDRRALITGFPAQLASLEEPVSAFLQGAFGGSALDPAPWLRGVYLTSGTQEGTPIDRLTGVLARSFGIDQKRAPSLRPVSGRSYFLTRLLREVILGEAMLGGAAPLLARRRLALRAGGFTLIGLAFAAVLAGLILSRRNNAEALAAMRTSLGQEQKAAASIRLDPVSSSDLRGILPLLNEARVLTAAKPRHGFLGLGLDQSAGLQETGETIYRNALDYALLPRLILQLEAEMRGKLNDPAYLYQATRVYLMLGSQGPLDRALVKTWMRLDWQRLLYPGFAEAEPRDTLMTHLTALLAKPLPAVPLDGALVATARATFSRVSLSERVYSRINGAEAASRLPAWTPAAALGPAGMPLFVYGSGKPLTEGIPGFYTVEGFYSVLLPALAHAAHDVAGESWVLGHTAEIGPNSPAILPLETGVVRLYEQDYAARWTAVLSDLDLAPLGDVRQTVQTLYVLASPQSPMQHLLVSISRQLTLTKPSASLQAAHSPALATKGNASAAAAAQLEGLFAPPQSAEPAQLGVQIGQKFAPLRDYVGNGGAGSPLGLTLELINQFQQLLAPLASTTPGTVPPQETGNDPAALLVGEAVHDPKPMRQWVQAIVAAAKAQRAGNAAAAAAAAFRAQGGPAQVCAQAVAHHFPFNPEALEGTPLADFSRLFAPGGLLDTFFNTQIRPFVDLGSRNWRVQSVNDVAPPVNQDAVAQFQRAQLIRQIFFGNGSTVPQIQFIITPDTLSSDLAKATLQLGALAITATHRPEVPTQVTWPGADGTLTAKLTMIPAGVGTMATLQASGPWALFRLFNQGHLSEDGSSSRYLLSFEQNGANVRFVIEAGSVLNPFAPGVLQNFHCPRLAG